MRKQNEQAGRPKGKGNGKRHWELLETIQKSSKETNPKTKSQTANAQSKQAVKKKSEKTEGERKRQKESSITEAGEKKYLR